MLSFLHLAVDNIDSMCYIEFMQYATEQTSAVSDVPHPRNFCGNGFPDWLEVNLTPACNAHCSWCIERNGWHPSHQAEWFTITDAAIASKRKNIILLGGEPTLHPDFSKIVRRISDAGCRCWVTTNGSMLTKTMGKRQYDWDFGVNISIHDDDLVENTKITGLDLVETNLIASISALHEMSAEVLMNCNCIRGHVDSMLSINQYIVWANRIGADKVRFAELKHADDDFVDLAFVTSHQYGTNDNVYFRSGGYYDARSRAAFFREFVATQSTRRRRFVPVLREIT